MLLVHLHVHSTHSTFDGYTSEEEYFRDAEEFGMPGLAITDHRFISAIPEIVASANMHLSVKPIIGVEAYMTYRYSHEDGIGECHKCFHVILLVKNEAGFRNLCALCLNRSIIPHELLERYREGLICTSACIGGEVPQAYLRQEYPKARGIAMRFRDLFGDDFCFEVSSHYSELPDSDNELFMNQQFVNFKVFKDACALGIKVVATNDVHFLNKEDGPVYNAKMCRKVYVSIDNPRIRFTQQEYFKTEEEMRMLFPGNGEVIDNTIGVLGKIEKYDLDGFLKYYNSEKNNHG